MTQIPISIDDLFQATSIGSLDKAIGNNLYGINHMQIPNAVPSNREQQGYIFFTRPQLNLQNDNLRNTRKLMPLLSDVSNVSIHRYLRTTLDPRLMVGYKYGHDGQNYKVNIQPIKSPLTNNEMAFIPVLTNNAISSAGWPDPVVPLFTSHEGRYGESSMMVDGLVDNFTQYSIDVTFRNTIADPILYMFYIWTLYTSYVFSGKLVPYPDFITERRIDYNTRIFRVRLDRNRHKVTKIMSTGPAIPVASSVGQFGDFDMNQPISDTNKDIQMRFQCMGFEIFDDILIYEFNRIVQMFKADMKDDRRDSVMVLLPRSISHLFQNRAYPRINPDNHVMEWWVDKSLFDLRSQAFLQSLLVTDVDITGDAEEQDEFDDDQDDEDND